MRFNGFKEEGNCRPVFLTVVNFITGKKELTEGRNGLTSCHDFVSFNHPYREDKRRG